MAVEVHTIYLTPQQASRVWALLAENEGRAVQIYQADLLTGGPHAGFVVVEETMGRQLGRFDRQGNTFEQTQERP